MVKHTTDPKICVITHDFPTARQPYRGAPIWRTLLQLRRYADLRVLCPVPTCFGADLLLQAARIYNQRPECTELAPIAVPYPAVPRVTHARNSSVLAPRLLKQIAADRPDVILSYWIYPDSCAAVMTG